MAKKENSEKLSYLQMENMLKEKDEKISVLTKDGEEMGETIASLKRSYAAIRGANTKCKAIVDALRRLNREADEMNEQRLERIEQLEREVDEQKKTIAGLESQNAELSAKKIKLTAAFEDANTKLRKAQTELAEYLTKPWYRKIFG